MSSKKMGVWDMLVDAGNPVSPKNAFTWSSEFRKMLGYESEDDFPNVLESWANRLHPDHKDATLKAFADHLNDYSGQTIYDIEYMLCSKDGEYRWYHASGEAERDENGVPQRIVGLLTDIHDDRVASNDNAFRNNAIFD